MFWIGLIVGLLVGAPTGFMITALCVAAGKSEQE